MLTWIKDKLASINNRMFPEIQYLVDKLEDNQRVLAKMSTLLEEEKEKIEYELAFYKGFSELLIEESPDMVWLKDVCGKYMVANTAIKSGLLFDYHPYGKTDVELAKAAKAKFGNENHTFGEVCGNSDLVILENLKPQRFLESGNIKGKMTYLEVFKFPFYVDGVLVGVAGIGRDLTEYIDALHDAKGCEGKMAEIFGKYEFKE